VHFLRLLAVWWPGAQSEPDNYVLACNFAKYSPILKQFSLSDSTINIFLIWLLTIPPRLKYVGSLPCNLSLIVCFLT